MRPAVRLLALALALLGAVVAFPAAASADSRGLAWPLRAIGLDRPLTAPAAPAVPRTTESGPIVVAIVDSGVDLHHRHLARKLWTNPGEVPGNGIDDDRNGWTDDVHGVDVTDPSRPPVDDEGHGTAAASVVVGRGGRRAQRGIAPRARIMAVRVLDADLNGTTTDVATGVRYAVANGADVVNLSLAARAEDPDLHAALARARDAGVLVVVSAGNHGGDLRTAPAFPAAHRDVGLLAVGASDLDGRLVDASARGPLVDLAAPGEEVAALGLHGRTRRFSGTSAAAPHVTGAAAVLMERAGHRTAGVVRAALVGGARRPRVLRRVVGAGALDVRRALARLVARP